MNPLPSIAALVSTSSGSHFYSSPYLDFDIVMALRGRGGVASRCLRRY